MPDYEQQWADGYHTNSKGVVIQLVDMPTPYLQNVIAKYGSEKYDTSVLDKVLDDRGDSLATQ